LKIKICPICELSVFQDIKNGYPEFAYVRCKSCSSVFSRASISPESLTDFYETYNGYDSPLISPNAVKTIRSWILRFENYRHLNRICDIGYGAGLLLQLASEKGWQCSGNEFADDSIKIGNENGWEIHRGALDSGALLGPFDVVTLIETIEHVPKPQSLICAAETRLRTGGIIFGTTPNGLSLNSRLFGGACATYEYPNHLVILSRKSLRMVLESAGFENIKIYSKGFNPYDFIKWLSNFGRQKSGAIMFGVSRADLGIRIDTRLRSNFLGRSTKFMIQGLLRVTGLGDSLVFEAKKPR
jgi:2-polyprenyl-3-methyl-5-hydroxy-6-metoxy-1,4-benzoquinol methylase